MCVVTARLNDILRITGIGGRIMLTPMVADLNQQTRDELFEAIRRFNRFERDTGDEHDFGAVDLGKDKYFFKLDYYDKSMEFGSPDPSDPSVTTRVMTVMHSSEY